MRLVCRLGRAAGGVTLPQENGVSAIDGSAFGGCKSLTAVTIPNSVESIGDYAFYGCENIATIEFAGGRQIAFGGNVFEGCVKLTKERQSELKKRGYTDRFQYRSHADEM